MTSPNEQIGPGGTGIPELLARAAPGHAVYQTDGEGLISGWSSGAEKLTGFSASEVLRESFSKFLAPEGQARGLQDQILRVAIEQGFFETQHWHTRKIGKPFRARLIAQAMPVGESGERTILMSTIDLSEQLDARRTLAESEARSQVVADAILDSAVYTLDPSGIIRNWNSGAERLQGYASADIIGRHLATFYTEEDRANAVPAHALEKARAEGRHESESWLLRKDGSRLWASTLIDAVRDETGRLVGFAMVVRDLTERQQAQESLRASERQFRLLVKGVTDYALYLLDPDGVITSWNDGAERIKGFTADEVVGNHFSRFYTESDRRSGLPERALHTARLEGRFESEGWRVRKDGSTFWANAVIDAIRDENGHLIGFAKITRDITERRESELALQKAQVERAHAQRMEALGKLTGGVAHDFNNLLMVVSGHLDTIKKNMPDTSRNRRAIDAIEHASMRGVSLTKQLLAFSRRQSLSPQDIDLAEQVQGLKALVEASVGGRMELSIQLPEELWPVRADPNELELALLNIVMNAKDAMPSGGKITISSRNIPAGEVGLGSNLNADFVELSVADTGCGMPPDILSKVFDPFFTTKAAGKGTGMGLSQVHGFAHQSGGTVRIESRLGQGTRVSMYLPRGAAIVSAAVAEQIASTSATGTALLVEDNPDVALATSSLAEGLGYEVVMAADSATALEIIDRRQISVVISDIVMAGSMDGLDLARELRKSKPDLPVLLVTGYTERLAEAEAEFPVLRKPFRATDLDRAISRAIAESKGSDLENVVSIRNRSSRD